MDESQESSPGPEPERLKLPFRDWTEAIREAFGGRSADDESEDEEEEAADG